jgi:exonuclease V gamma subunit
VRRRLVLLDYCSDDSQRLHLSSNICEIQLRARFVIFGIFSIFLRVVESFTGIFIVLLLLIYHLFCSEYMNRILCGLGGI